MIISDLEVGDTVLIKCVYPSNDLCIWIDPMDDTIGKEFQVTRIRPVDKRSIQLSNLWWYLNDSRYLEVVSSKLEYMSKSKYLEFDRKARIVESGGTV